MTFAAPLPFCNSFLWACVPQPATVAPPVSHPLFFTTRPAASYIATSRPVSAITGITRHYKTISITIHPQLLS